MAEAVLTGWQEEASGPELAKAPTGITGLDHITKGGLPRGRVSLVTGGDHMLGGGGPDRDQRAPRRVRREPGPYGHGRPALGRPGRRRNIRRICDGELKGRADLKIVDVRSEPALVVRDQVIATPTLVKSLPEPLRRIVGNLSDTARLRESLDLRPDPDDATRASRDEETDG